MFSGSPGMVKRLLAPCCETRAPTHQTGGLQLQRWRQSYSFVVMVQNFLRKLQLATSFLVFPPSLSSLRFVAVRSTYLHAWKCLTQLKHCGHCLPPSYAGRAKGTVLVPRRGGQRGPNTTACVPLHGKARSISTRRNVWCRSASQFPLEAPQHRAGLGRGTSSTGDRQTSQDMLGYSQHAEHNVPAFEAGKLEGKLIP